MEKIILLGASGQLGREWQAFFASLDSAEFILVPYTRAQLDITDFEKTDNEVREQQPDLIINCAAYTKVDEAEEQREEAKKINAEALDHLGTLCKKTECKLVHFSTDYIFSGRKEDGQIFPDGYPEGHKPDPVNWYGRTKWEGEEAIVNSGCRHLIVRVSWLCGAHGTNFVTTMLRLAEKHNELNVVSDQWASPTFTDNLVENTFKLIEENKEGTYHLTSQGIIHWARFAEAIFDKAGKSVEVHPITSADYPTQAQRPFFSKLNTDKINRVKGIKTEPWEAGLSRMLRKIDQK